MLRNVVNWTVQSHIATDGRSVSKSWCRAQIVITLLTVVVMFLWGALSDERTGLSFVYAAGLASAVFLGSDSHGTRDHILLSQIWDFPFCRLLRLAGSRWRYSTPPPHGVTSSLVIATAPRYIASARTTQQTPLPTVLVLHHVAVAQIA
jgi:hypothetical protein